ncbi:InlB B-repeat-containing protein [Ruminococcus bicirculans (ex Wegman et al. 2014)]|uniref:InlB B-repeat-containing protein n=1 Tax=Ruminococcus bicirculans (ex Wegman et al. 2014) TaxID=1160721 RepID=UPI003FD81877
MGGDPKCDGHKLPCLFEAGYYEPHYMTTGSKERIFPHTFVLDRSLDAVGGGRVDVLRCSVCDYTVPVKSHVHDYGWNWDYTGFGSIYEYTFNIGGSTKTVEELIIESDYAHPEKCKIPGCEEFIMVPHSWGRWNVVKNPDTTGSNGGMEAECSICEYTKTKIDKDDDEAADQWTKDTALVTVKNGRATRMIVKPGDKIRLYPEERTDQKAIGWKVEYRREYNEYDIISGTGLPVTKNWNASEAKTMFKLMTNDSALEWGCTIPEFSAMGATGGGSFFFEPVYAGCDHSGGTTVLNAKEQICDRKGYTGDTACADCGHVISAGSDIYPPANAGHTGPLQPLYYYGTLNSATTDASHGGKRYNAKSGDCRHRAYEGDYRCTACGGTVKGETGDFRHSGPLELRDVRTATCTERGYSGNQYCTSCDRIAHKGVSTPSLHEIADNYKLINEVKPGCTTSGYSGDQQCTAGCGQIIRYGHVVNKLSHDWDGGKPAKQGKSEGILYTCQRADCGETRFVRSSAATEFTVTVIKGTASVAAGTLITDKIAQNTVVTVTADAPEAGKVFDKWVVLEGNVTLADATKATTTFTMPGNDVKLEATYKDAPPSHTHSYGTEWKYDDTDHWHECECGDKANIAAHSASEWIVDTAATETADGAKHKECTVCKKVLETAPIPATGSNHTHSYGTEWKYDGTNHWHECECGDKADTAAHSFQWEIDKAATKEATGIKHEECTVCGAKRSENTVIDKLPDGGNTGNTSSSDNNTNKPGNDDSTKCPQTGDSSNHIGWLAALYVSGGVLTLLGVSGKKRKESEVK